MHLSDVQDLFLRIEIFSLNLPSTCVENMDEADYRLTTPNSLICVEVTCPELGGASGNFGKAVPTATATVAISSVAVANVMHVLMSLIAQRCQDERSKVTESQQTS